MLNKMICSVEENLIVAWKIINENGKGIVFICDENKKLLGILTDGDIRSFLLGNNNLNSSIVGVMNTKFVYARDTTKTSEILSLFNERIKIIPLVDIDFRLVDFMEYSTNIHIPVAVPDLKGKEFEYLTDAFLSTWISSTGKYINRFEKEFAAYCKTDYGVAVSNGTVALQLAMDVLGVGPGDEVIVPDLTFAATINTVLHRNATPVIVDVEEDSWCIDPKEILKAITPKTKAIIPVHVYGQVCAMDEIMKIAKQHNLYVIEDCAEAHGAEFNGEKVGSIGHIGCFSFYGNKIITTGEGGMCLTNDAELDRKMRVLRDHGMSKEKRYWHDYVGYNFRMTNLQAAIGVAQLERIEEILANRNIVEKEYKKKLEDINSIEFQRDNLANRKKIVWFVCILVEGDRDKFIEELNKEGIDARPFFYPLSEMPIYKEYVFSNAVCKKISAKGVNLPTNNKIKDSVIQKIKAIAMSFQK
jgi:perosamine synthetase